MTAQRDRAIKHCRSNIALFAHFVEHGGDGWSRMLGQERGRLEQLIADARAAASSTIMPREVGERSTEHFVVVGDHTPEPRVAHEPYHPLIGGSI